MSKTTIDQVSSFIQNTSYDSWNLVTNNCVHFAVDVWNLCVDNDREICNLQFIPSGLESEIASLEDSYTGNTFNIPSSITFGFFDGNEFVYHTH